MKLVFIQKCQLIFLLMLFVAANSFSQGKTHMGGNATVELLYGSLLVPGAGITIERQVTKHSGIESGIYYRSFIRNLHVQTSTELFNYSVSERYISIPFLYKFYSSFVNLSVGPTFDYFVGWKQKSGSPGVKVDSYSVSPAIAIGVLAKVSKRINLTDRFILEPELRFNPIISAESAYVGFGIAAKVRL